MKELSEQQGKSSAANKSTADSPQPTPNSNTSQAQNSTIQSAADDVIVQPPAFSPSNYDKEIALSKEIQDAEDGLAALAALNKNKE